MTFNYGQGALRLVSQGNYHYTKFQRNLFSTNDRIHTNNEVFGEIIQATNEFSLQRSIKIFIWIASVHQISSLSWSSKMTQANQLNRFYFPLTLWLLAKVKATEYICWYLWVNSAYN